MTLSIPNTRFICFMLRRIERQMDALSSSYVYKYLGRCALSSFWSSTHICISVYPRQAFFDPPNSF